MTFLIYIIWAFSAQSDSKAQFHYTAELMNMTRDSRVAHTYSFVWPLRRLLFAISVMTLRSIPYYYSVSILVFVQVSYLLYLSLARPLTSIRAMIFEIGGEIVILIATLLVFVLNTSEQWTPKINWIYISTIG